MNHKVFLTGYDLLNEASAKNMDGDFFALKKITNDFFNKAKNMDGDFFAKQKKSGVKTWMVIFF